MPDGVVFRGADAGLVGSGGALRVERALSVDDARGSGALVAYAMNGEPLPLQHGRPVRLIVPSWYAVASVEWLTEIEVIGQPFEAFFQTKRWHSYYWERDGGIVRRPVACSALRRALIAEPADGASVTGDEFVVRGVAWSGAAPMERAGIVHQRGSVAARTTDRRTPPTQLAVLEFLAHCDVRGPGTVRARATDQAGRTQPEQPEWNRLGYGGNAIQTICVEIE